jgi:hypothetical protein
VNGEDAVLLVVLPAEHVPELKVLDSLLDRGDLRFQLPGKRGVGGFSGELAQALRIVKPAVNGVPAVDPELAAADLLHDLLRGDIVVPEVLRVGTRFAVGYLFFFGIEVKDTPGGRSAFLRGRAAGLSDLQT